KLILLGINIVGDHIDVVVVPQPFAQCFDQGCFSRADRTADPDAQRAVIGSVSRDRIGDRRHERKILVYCVSCAMDASSTMNAADPRSRISDLSASALASCTACASAAIASCPSV